MKNLAVYAASKGGIHALTKQLAVELAPYKIRVNTFAPGPTQVERNLVYDIRAYYRYREQFFISMALGAFVAILALVGTAGCGHWPPIVESKSQIDRLDVTTVEIRARGLRDATGLPLLGVVTLVPNDAMQLAERKDLRKFVLAAGGLIGAFVLGVALMAIFAERIA